MVLERSYRSGSKALQETDDHHLCKKSRFRKYGCCAVESQCLLASKKMDSCLPSWLLSVEIFNHLICNSTTLMVFDVSGDVLDPRKTENHLRFIRYG